MDQKTQSNYMLSTKRHFILKNTFKSKAKGWKKIYHASSYQKWSGYIYIRQNRL